MVNILFLNVFFIRKINFIIYWTFYWIHISLHIVTICLFFFFTIIRSNILQLIQVCLSFRVSYRSLKRLITIRIFNRTIKWLLQWTMNWHNSFILPGLNIIILFFLFLIAWFDTWWRSLIIVLIVLKIKMIIIIITWFILCYPWISDNLINLKWPNVTSSFWCAIISNHDLINDYKILFYFLFIIYLFLRYLCCILFYSRSFIVIRLAFIYFSNKNPFICLNLCKTD